MRSSYPLAPRPRFAMVIRILSSFQTLLWIALSVARVEPVLVSSNELKTSVMLFKAGAGAEASEFSLDLSVPRPSVDHSQRGSRLRCLVDITLHAHDMM